MELIMKKEFRVLVLRFYETENLTQEKMAEALLMDRRSYAAIVSGKSACGGLTILLLLTHLKDPNAFLQQLKEEMTLVEKGQ